MKKIMLGGALLAAALLLSGCGGRAPQVQPTQEPAATATAAPVATAQPTTEPAGPAGFVQPCVDQPYDYYYADDAKQIAIHRYSQNEITFLAADVQLTDASQFRIALSKDAPFSALEPASTMAQRNGAVLAINADDYGVHDYGTIIRDGALLRAHDTTRNMLIVDQNGDFSVRVDRNGEDPEALAQQLIDAGVRHSFEFGPELIRDGAAVEFSPDFDVISTSPTRREPRTAIGQIGPLHYIVVVADGRQPGYSKGMTLPELQQVFLHFGAQTAVNLDGGDSAEMWFQGEIISRPAEGAERKLSDIIWF